MRVNIGCGEFYAPGWTNIDTATDKDRHPDLLGSILDLPPEVQDVQSAYLGHVLEHIDHPLVVPALTLLRGRMAPGAPVLTVGPDIHRAQDLHDRGLLDQATLDACGTGGLRWDGDRHWWACHEQLLIDALTDAGYENVTPHPVTQVALQSWPVTSFAPWQCAVSALTPGLPVVP